MTTLILKLDAALAQSVITEATVIRNGQKVRLNSCELVPGDLVLLTSGDKVPADLRLVELRDLQVSEAALTGESVPVQEATEPLTVETVLADRLNMWRMPEVWSRLGKPEALWWRSPTRLRLGAFPN
nr:hypothetical protein [Leptolyngbya sp. BC1307]